MGKQFISRRICRTQKQQSHQLQYYSTEMFGILKQLRSKIYLATNANRQSLCFKNGIASTGVLRGNTSSKYTHEEVKVISDRNIKESMQSKRFGEILRGWFVYKLFSFDKIVENSDTLTKISQRVFGSRLFEKLMKMTIYGHFVAGEGKGEVAECISKLKENGIKCVLDYSAEEDVSDEQKVSHEMRTKLMQTLVFSEDIQSLTKEYKPTEQTGESVKRATARTYFYEDESKCDKNRDIFLECITMAAEATERGKGFAAIKITALSDPRLLLKLGEKIKLKQDLFFKLTIDTKSNSPYSSPAAISQESFSQGLAGLGFVESSQTQQDMFSQLKAENSSLIHSGAWHDLYTEDTDLYKLMKSKESTKHYAPVLRPFRQLQYENVISRLLALSEHSQALKVRLMVDAEQSYFQNAINHITVHCLMPKYNQHFPTIYNTHQCYLRKAYQQVLSALEYGESCGFTYGLKLVRGAYMDQERTRSRELGYTDPILPDINATHEMYHTVMEACLKKVKQGKASLMVASHNKDSVERAVELMRHFSISPTEGVVFGQLLGMCDYISLPLSRAGYQVYKYTPYGPVREVIPYLARRALENRGLLKGADFEREVLGRELKRRILPWYV